jgi:hypothetical protein
MNIQLKASAPVGALPRIESNAEDLRIVEGGPVAESGLAGASYRCRQRARQSATEHREYAALDPPSCLPRI